MRYPERDAQSIYTTLISEEGGRFSANHVHMLTGTQANKANILHEIQNWLPSVTAPDDRVLIYFAGHGFISAGKGYLAPYDIDLHNIADTAISMDTVGTLVGTTIKGKWKVLLTDACHSGAITPETVPAELNHLLLDVHKSIFSLTASRDREQSFERSDLDGGHGIFTYYVVRGLAGEADANGDGIVTADELAEYVHTNVRSDTGGRQNPTSERGSFDANMVLAYHPSDGKGRITTATLQYGTLVVQTNMDNTELWLDGKQMGVVTKASALRLPGIAPGAHTIKGVHMGYEPDGPREEMVYPGQETTVNLRILIPRQRKQAAVDLLDHAIEDYKKGFEANYRKAEQKLNQAVSIDPNYSQAYVYLGRVENALYEDEKAKAAFERAIQIDPDYEDARVSYAAALLDQGGVLIHSDKRPAVESHRKIQADAVGAFLVGNRDSQALGFVFQLPLENQVLQNLLRVKTLQLLGNLIVALNLVELLADVVHRDRLISNLGHGVGGNFSGRRPLRNQV